MPDFPVVLAIFNCVPVALTALALALLARWIGDLDRALGWAAWTGGGLVVLGGAAKVAWKLIAALTGADLVWLASVLFPLMAPGFALVALAVWGAGRRLAGRPVPRWAWGLALAAIVLAFAAAGWREWALAVPRGWFLPLLVLASLANLVVGVLLVRLALGLRAPLAAGLVAANLAMVFALAPIAMVAEKTLAYHWLEQTLTALGAGGFALGVFLARRAAPALPLRRVGATSPR